MLRTILVPLDGSPLAESALGPAGRLARQTGAGLILLRAAPPLSGTHTPAAPLRMTVGEVRAYLEAVAARMEAAGFNVRVEVIQSEPHRAIRSAVRHGDADLIVMSTHGHTGLRRLVLGSVTEQVLHEAEVPLLIVRAMEHLEMQPTGSIRRILVPLNGAAFAEAALSYLARMQLAHDAEVILLRTVPHTVPVAIPGLPDSTARHLAETERMATEQQLLEARQYLETAGQRHLHGHLYYPQVMTGYPAKAIVDVAEAERVDLLLMATHGRIGLDHMLHYGVTRHVLHHSHVPMLMLHDKETALPVQATAAVAPASTAGSAHPTTGPIDGDD